MKGLAFVHPQREVGGDVNVVTHAVKRNMVHNFSIHPAKSIESQTNGFWARIS